MWGLGSIGGFLGNVGKTIGGGIAKGAKTVGGNIKDRFTQMSGMDDATGSGKAVPMTPGFNPNAPDPRTPGMTAQEFYKNIPLPGQQGETPKMEVAPSPLGRMSRAEQNRLGFQTMEYRYGEDVPGRAETMEIRRPNHPNYRPDVDGGRIQLLGGQQSPPRLPIPALDMKPPMPLTPTQQSGHPPLTDFDTDTGRMAGSPPPKPMPPLTGVNPMSGQLDAASIPTIRDSVEITDTAPRLAPSPVPPMLDRPPAQLPQDPSRKDIPIPALPNRGYDPTPYNDYDAARYDYTMKHAKRDAEGNFAPGGGFERNWKSILQNALAGAANYADTGDWGKMLGGAIGGGAGAAVNPQRGYEIAFDRGHGAHMQQAQGMRDARTEQERKMQMGGLELENKKSQIEARRTQAERQQAVADSQIKYNEARAEAARRGTPDEALLVNPESGLIESVNVYPDGRRDVLGVSGDAMIKGATLEAQNQRDALNRESREREGALNRKSRESIALIPGRLGGAGIPGDAKTEYTRVQRLKQKAEAAWARAKNPPPNADPQALLEEAQAAQNDYNAYAEDFGTLYGDYYDVSNTTANKKTGDPGWMGIKPKALPPSRQNAPSAAAQASVSPRAVEEYAREKGVSIEEAKQRFAAKGIQIK